MELKTKFNLKVFGIGHCNPPLITMPGFGEHLVLHSIPKSKKIVMFREALPCHKGSSIYYVITFGGLGRPPPPYVILLSFGHPRLCDIVIPNVIFPRFRGGIWSIKVVSDFTTFIDQIPP